METFIVLRSAFGRCTVHPVSRIAKDTSRTVKREEMNLCILAAAWEIQAGSVRH